MASWCCVWPTSWGLTQNPVDHETIFIACHVGLHVGLLIFSNFFGHWGPQALVECEVGRSRNFSQMMGHQALVWSALRKKLEGWDSYITSPHEPFIHAAICTITDRLQLLKILACSSCCTHTRRHHELVYIQWCFRDVYLGITYKPWYKLWYKLWQKMRS